MKLHLSVRFATLASLGILALGSVFSNLQAQQSYNLTPLWSLAPESYEWIATNNVQRGLAFNPVTQHLLTVSRYPETNAAIYIHNSQDGTYIGNMDVNGVFAEINFPLNMIGVAADGAIYACNLTVDSTNAPTGNNGPFRIYRWANEGASPTVAYIGDPSNEDPILNHRRFGDAFAIRGSGVNTEILVSARLNRTVARFTTVDGLNFTHQKIEGPEMTGAANTMTIAFGTNNTFWIKTESNVQTNSPLLKFSFDINTATATLLHGFTNSPVRGGPLGFDPSRNLLAVVRTLTHELNLYKMTDLGPVQQGATIPFPAIGPNPNGNFTGSIAFSEDKLFALESNNGILAFLISTNSLAPFSTSVAVNSGDAALSWPGANGFIYQSQYKDSLSDPGWIDLESPATGTGAVLSVTDPVGANSSRFYRVVAQ